VFCLFRFSVLLVLFCASCPLLGVSIVSLSIERWPVYVVCGFAKKYFYLTDQK
jgi:hypothetical protein